MSEIRGGDESRVHRGLSRAGWFSVVWLVFAAGCGAPKTPYPAALNSERPDERAWAIRHAAEARDLSALPLLVDRLEDEDEAVRFFAILALEKLTGTRLGYDYRLPEVQRWRAVDNWRRYLARSGLPGRPSAQSDNAKAVPGSPEAGQLSPAAGVGGSDR